LRIGPQEEAWKHQHPKKRIFEHSPVSARFQVKPCCPDGLMSNE
jgi:hypothetical protein